MEKLKKIWPFLASLGGASVMVLAFFIPSIQDQWDRYQSRQVIMQYEKLGDQFFDEELFAMAEEAYAKAFEMSESKRLDIEVKRLDARINRVNENPAFGGKLPDSLREIDFQYLLHFQQNKKGEKAHVLDSYGVFLTSKRRFKEAEQAFTRALQADSKYELAHVNLGSLYRHQGKLADAKREYFAAIAIDPDNARTRYNLALLLIDQQHFEEARKELTKVLQLDPGEKDAREQLESVNNRLSQGGKK